MSKLRATLFAAFLFVSCSNDSVPDLSLPCEGLGYYDPETHYCHQELRPRCEDENNCANTGSESCSITSAAQKGHAYEISCEGKHIGYLDNGTSGEKGESGLDGTNGKNCSIDSTESGVKITCGTLSLPLSHGTVGIDGTDGENGIDGIDGKDGKDGIDGESCTIAKTDKGVEIKCGTMGPLPLTHGEPGKDGTNGTKGDDCTITETNEGVEITCGTMGPLPLDRGDDGGKGDKGDPGAAGEGCTIKYISGKVDIITCDEVVSLLNPGEPGNPASAIDIIDGYWYIDGNKTVAKVGEKGDNCTVEDKGDRFEMTCGTKTVDWPKAMCMATPYDPAKQFCDSRDYNTYKYVEIGSQTWMGQNLNYDTKTAGSACHSNLESNCDIYGRLYNWAAMAAMAVCPAGWHLPSDAEWDALTNFVGDNPGTKLKATNGWNSGNGTDDFGFAALPGGLYTGGFYNVGTLAYWWSSNSTYGRYMASNNGNVTRTEGSMSSMYSVRCVQDVLCGDKAYDPATQFCYDNGKIGDFCGSRKETFDPDLYECKTGNKIYLKTPVSYEGQNYDAVLIGEQTWLAQNLNYDATGSVYYQNNQAANEKYGRMYNWATAMEVCPSGWHLPDTTEWGALASFIKSDKSCANDCDAKYLKAISDWNNNNGEDSYGFAALPGGYGNPNGSNFYQLGNYGEWWSRSTNELNGDEAYIRYIFNNGVVIGRSYADKASFRGVRCMKDD